MGQSCSKRIMITDLYTWQKIYIDVLIWDVNQRTSLKKEGERDKHMLTIVMTGGS